MRQTIITMYSQVWALCKACLYINRTLVIYPDDLRWSQMISRWWHHLYLILSTHKMCIGPCLRSPEHYQRKMANQIHIHNYHAMDNRSLLKLQQHAKVYLHVSRFPDSKVHGANMGSIWVRQDPGGPHICPMNFASWVVPLWVVWYLPIVHTAFTVMN